MPPETSAFLRKNLAALPRENYQWDSLGNSAVPTVGQWIFDRCTASIRQNDS
jgi:hypothetical protein